MSEWKARPCFSETKRIPFLYNDIPPSGLARADEKRTRAGCGWALVTDDVEISINIRTGALSYLIERWIFLFISYI